MTMLDIYMSVREIEIIKISSFLQNLRSKILIYTTNINRHNGTIANGYNTRTRN